MLHLGESAKKQKNVSLYVCMSTGNSEMLVFLSVWEKTQQQCVFFKFFNGRLEKTEKC